MKDVVFDPPSLERIADLKRLNADILRGYLNRRERSEWTGKDRFQHTIVEGVEIAYEEFDEVFVVRKIWPPR